MPGFAFDGDTSLDGRPRPATGSTSRPTATASTSFSVARSSAAPPSHRASSTSRSPASTRTARRQPPARAISGTTTGRRAVTTGRSWPSTRLRATAPGSWTCRRMRARPVTSPRSAEQATPRSRRRRTFRMRQGSRPAAGCSPPHTTARGSTERRWCRGSLLSQPLSTRCSGARRRRSRRSPPCQDPRDVCGVAAHAGHVVVPGARPQSRAPRRVDGNELVEATRVARGREADLQDRRNSSG